MEIEAHLTFDAAFPPLISRPSCPQRAFAIRRNIPAPSEGMASMPARASELSIVMVNGPRPSEPAEKVEATIVYDPAGQEQVSNTTSS